MPNSQQDIATINNEYQYGFAKRDTSTYKTRKGLSEEIVREISRMKDEPAWMTDFRAKAYHLFTQKAMPQWGGNLNEIDFDEITYFNRPTDKKAASWEELPEEIKDTYDKILPQ